MKKQRGIGPPVDAVAKERSTNGHWVPPPKKDRSLNWDKKLGTRLFEYFMVVY
jgi:hypothetical protein